MRMLALLVVCVPIASASAQQNSTEKPVKFEGGGAVVFVTSPPMPKLDSAKAYVERGEARLAVGWQENAVRVVDQDGKVLFRPGWPRGIPLADFDAALELDPKCVRAFVGRGRSHLMRQSRDDAMKDFDRALALSPNNVPALIGRGDALASSGKDEYDKALRDYNRALELDPNNVDAHVGRGWVYLYDPSQRDAAKGLADFLRACELTEFKSWWHMHRLALACEHRGKYAEAAKWQRAVEKDFERRKEPLPEHMKILVSYYEREAKAQRENK